VKAEDVGKIAVIGQGMMGHGIAQVFASKGFDVQLYGRREEGLRVATENIRSNLSKMAIKGVIQEGEIASTLGRIRTTTSLAEATAGAQMVIETVAENLELKQGLFEELDCLSPRETILTTNTSVISISEVAARARYRERIVGTHFWNPPFLIPLVEIVKGRDTLEEVQDVTYDVLRKAGKHPVKVKKDVPGFLANRLQHALWREAISIVEHGIADAAGVDECIKMGFGIRLPVLGPMENADMVGLDMTLAIHDYILKHLESSPGPSPLLKEKVERGQLGFKTGQGFRTWSAEEAKESRERLLDYLLDWMVRERGRAEQ